jgi:MFS family permease
MQIVAVIVAAVMIPVSLLVRRPPALAGGNAPASGDAGPQPEMSLSQAVRSPQFIILLATNFFCCATHSGPIIHTVSYAVSCGIPLVAAVSIYSLEGLAGLGGRIAFGLLGDRFGAKRVLVLGLLAQAFGALAYAFVRELAAFYAVAALFGFIYAGVMPLYAVLARENFPLKMMGTVIGGTAMAGSLGMATGPIAGGLIYDAFASYAWLYIGAWGMGLGAFLMALSFRPFPKAHPAPVPA